MNFFERQQVARRNTRVMIVLFMVAVVCIVVAVDFVLALSWAIGFEEAMPRAWYAWGALITVGAIFAVSLWEVLRLRAGGGETVAAMVGGRRVKPNTPDLLERRLLNVVEEMAIAAGTRVPAVFVMDEEAGINAFAAGYDVSRTAVTVTRGTLETLNRDELQAVIGHEFSHIVNGDTSLNIHMMGVLAGIIFLGAVGGFILRNLRDSGSSSGRKSKDKDFAALWALGIGLYVVGYVGLFFARLIKASISRQREFLADASSVQFTRNPDGLAGALDQMRASGRTSLVASRHAEDVSHMFFGQGVAMGFNALFATHPPLEERIKRVNPRFQPSGYRTKRTVATDTSSVATPEGAMGFGGAAPAAVPAEAREGDPAQAWGRSPRESARLVGTVDDKKVDIAKRMLAAIPEGVRERARDPEGAAAIVIALLLANQDTVMQTQLAAMKTAGAGRLADAAGAIAKDMRAIGPAYYLLVIDLALPALKLASPEAQSDLLNALQAVIRADRRVGIFEFVVFTLVRSQLNPRKGSGAPKYKSLADVRDEASFLLSLIVHAGCHRGPNADRDAAVAFQAGAKELGTTDGALLARKDLGLDRAGEVLEKLRDLAPMPKAVLVKALFAAVSADGSIRIIEAALMRTVGAVLDCPLPPLLEDLDPATLSE
jgi:Zn-dependent protease with chaperone function